MKDISRRSMLKGTAMVGGGALLGFSELFGLTRVMGQAAGTPEATMMADDDLQTIINLASTAELFATTHYLAAINGAKDLQVPAKVNLAEIEKALRSGGNCQVKTVELPGLNHLFQPCQSGSPSEYASIETTMAPEVLKTIGEWIREQTAAR
jgi:fermentation-respiration switch protein FrsA (DUF1100 family)